MKEVKLDFSPVYWLANGTIVPTTTTTTTSTSSTTTTHPSTTNKGLRNQSNEPKPLHEPPVVQMTSMGPIHSGPDSLENSLPSDTVDSNEIPDNLSEKHQKPNLAGITYNSGSSIASSTQIHLLLPLFNILFIILISKHFNFSSFDI